MATNTLPALTCPANPVRMPPLMSAGMHGRKASDDTLTCWTADPRAVKLLASCAALPPVNLEHRARYGNSVDKWTAFAGYRVEALETIRMEVGERLMQAYHQHGDGAYEPFRQWCEQPNASDAVGAVISAARSIEQ